MRKILITGSQGFVGRYLRHELSTAGYSIIGMDIRGTRAEGVLQADIMNSEQVKSVIKAVSPDVIFHLAGRTNILDSWREPQRTVEINLLGAVNLLEAVRDVNKDIRLVLIGSADQYGSIGDKNIAPDESARTQPETPYAVSKKAQEELAQIYVKAYGMNICMTRSFNHSGAGQQEGFIIPDFAAGIARIEAGIANILKVGNLSAKRDFTHVKDIVRAYRLIAEKGRSGEIYNVGSGKMYSVQNILDHLCSMANCLIPVTVDPQKFRPNDTTAICCNYSKLNQDTGWKPQHTMKDILCDILEYYRLQYKLYQTD